VTYTILIDAFAKENEMDRAFEILLEIEKTGLEVDAHTYGVLLHALCMEGWMPGSCSNQWTRKVSNRIMSYMA
jgi:pentatricopeptide repeat protein